MVIAPAVEKQDCLLPFFRRFAQRRGKVFADGGEHAAPLLPAHIRQAHLRQNRPGVALRQRQQGIAPLTGAFVAFQRRGGRAEQHRCFVGGGAVSCHVPRVVFGVHIRFIGMLMLLVQHDQPQILHRGKHCRAGTHDHARFSGENAVIGVHPFPGGERRVHHRHLTPIAGGKNGEGLGRERDFRQQHDGAFAKRQHFVDQFEHHAGFAAAGHAVQQYRVRLPVRGKAGKRFKRRRLLPVQGKVRRRAACGQLHPAEHPLRAHRQKPFFTQCVGLRFGKARRAQFRVAFFAVLQHCQQGFLLLTQSAGGCFVRA